MPFRLGTFLVSNSMQFLNFNFKSLFQTLSDHKLIQIEFDFQIEFDRNLLRGCGFWKFNVEYSKDLDYMNLINSELK